MAGGAAILLASHGRGVLSARIAMRAQGEGGRTGAR